MISILYVHHGTGIGGAPLSLLYLIRGLDPERFRPTVLCIHESEAAQLFRDEGIETIVDNGIKDFSHTNVLWYPWWQFPKTLYRLLHVPVSVRRVSAFLAKRRFDIVHLNTSTLIAAGMAAHRSGAKVVWHIREPLNHGYFGLRRSLIRNVIDEHADLIIPICRYDAAQLKPCNRIHVVYNFVDFRKFDSETDGSPVRKQLGIGNDQPVVLMLGGVNPVKGTLQFVQAAVELLRDRPDTRFLIAGPLPGKTFRNSLNGLSVYRKNVLRSLPPDVQSHVHFLGQRSDIPELLAAADVLCFPSTVPHFARPAIEASAMEVPVVASDLGGPKELVRHGETGLLVEAGSSKALAAALGELLDDPRRRAKMGRAGKQFALTHFDSVKNTREVIDLYEKLMSEK